MCSETTSGLTGTRVKIRPSRAAAVPASLALRGKGLVDGGTEERLNRVAIRLFENPT
jgi:hypothetical protein